MRLNFWTGTKHFMTYRSTTPRQYFQVYNIYIYFLYICLKHPNYHETNFREMVKRMKADDRGEPGRESRSFDYITSALTATFGWFTSDFFFLLLVFFKLTNISNWKKIKFFREQQKFH